MGEREMKGEGLFTRNGKEVSEGEIIRFEEVCESCGRVGAKHFAGKCPSIVEGGWPEMTTRRVGGTGDRPEYAVSFGSKDSNPKDRVGSSKAPMSTVPAGVLAELGLALLEGKAKYGAFNYRKAGVRSSVYYDATMRHLMAWFEGEDIDPDSGLSHITKAIASLVVLRDAQRNDMVNDDRPPSRKIGYPELNQRAAEIIERHKDKDPHHWVLGEA